MAQTIFFKKLENNVAIAAGATWSPNSLTQLTLKDTKYAPFNSLTFFNTSSVDVNLILSAGVNANDARQSTEFVPAGATLVIEPDEGIFFVYPIIENRDGSVAIAVNELILQVRKVV